MVRALHAAGIEVILDVVYNHTAEGNQLGPTLSMRGIDNASYYRLSPEDQRYYMDFTGCGNTLNMIHPRVLQLIMDSLRYWVLEMHVDGFRFDLASTLARELHAVNKLGAFFDIIHQDPILSQVKLIAEPWDVGEGGYQVGNFPVLWTEWNGKYRDTVRRFWKGDGGTASEFATRLAAAATSTSRAAGCPTPASTSSPATTASRCKIWSATTTSTTRPTARTTETGPTTINSWNCGAEGPTDDPAINDLRERQKRNLIATLLLVAGRADDLRRRRIEPHAEGQQQRLLPGQRTHLAELGIEPAAEGIPGVRPQGGADLAGTAGLPASQVLPGPRHPRLGHHGHLLVRAVGKDMSDEAWNAGFVKCLGVRLAGDLIGDVDERGEPIVGDTLLLLLNAHHEAIPFTLPATKAGTPLGAAAGHGRPRRPDAEMEGRRTVSA